MFTNGDLDVLILRESETYFRIQGQLHSIKITKQNTCHCSPAWWHQLASPCWLWGGLHIDLVMDTRAVTRYHIHLTKHPLLCVEYTSTASVVGKIKYTLWNMSTWHILRVKLPSL